MNIITLDFETFYSKDYSLSKLTTEEYVRDPRFQVLGCALLTHDGAALWLDPLQPGFARALRDHMEAHDAVLCHHAHFDGLILSHHYGISPAMWLDTLSLARVVHPGEVLSLAALAQRYGLPAKGDALTRTRGLRREDVPAATYSALAQYARGDVHITRALLRELTRAASRIMPLAVFREELRLIDWTIRAFTEPRLVVDTDAAQRALDAAQAETDALVAAAGVTPDVLSSNNRFRQWLIDYGLEPPKSLAKSSSELKAWAEQEDDPALAAVVQARLGVKSTIARTRAERLLAAGQRGPLPVYYKYYGAHTGRFSGGDKMNLQNLPRGSALRRAILAPPGHVLVAADASQIEARVLAWLAGERELLATFAAGADVYRAFGAVAFGKKPEEITSAERFVSKTCVLGLGYGTGHKKLHITLQQGGAHPPDGEAARLVRVYRETYARIVGLWRDCERALGYLHVAQPWQSAAYPLRVSAEAGLVMPSGRAIRYPGLAFSPAIGYTYRPSKVNKKIYGAKVVENVVQALARDIIVWHMMQIHPRYPVAMMTHDEIIAVVPEQEAQEAEAWILSIMGIAPEWAQGLPLKAEAKTAKEYSK